MVRARKRGGAGDQVVPVKNEEDDVDVGVARPPRQVPTRQVIVHEHVNRRDNLQTAANVAKGLAITGATVAGLYGAKKVYDQAASLGKQVKAVKENVEKAINRGKKVMKKVQDRHQHVMNTLPTRNEIAKTVLATIKPKDVVKTYEKELKTRGLKPAAHKSRGKSLVSALWTAGKTVSSKGLDGLKRAWRGKGSRGSLGRSQRDALAFLCECLNSY